MANTRKVLLSLHTEVADRLDREANKSATADALFAAHYGLSFEGTTAASLNRQSILDRLLASSTEVAPVPDIVPEPTPEVENVISTTTTEAPVEAVELISDVDIAIAGIAPEPVVLPEGEAQPDSGFIPVLAPTDGFVPLVQPLDAVIEPTPEPILDVPVIEPIQTPAESQSLVEAMAEAETIIEPELPELPTEPVEVDPPLPTEAVPEPIQPEIVLPTEPVVDTITAPDPVTFTPGTVLNPDGKQICPTCKEEMITPVCLNCL